MYIPSVLATGIRTTWLNEDPSTSNGRFGLLSNNEHQDPSQRNVVATRKSEFPPLSCYSASQPMPLYMKKTSQRVYRKLKTLKLNSDLDGSNNENTFESIEQLSLELGNRINHTAELSTWGYKWIAPLGVGKTMSQLLEEEKMQKLEEFVDVEGFEHEDVQPPGESMSVDATDHPADEDNTHLMTENFGQMHRTTAPSNANDNFTIDGTTEGSISRSNILSLNGGYQDDAQPRQQMAEGEERDLDAELSDHDVSGYEEHDAFYGDEDYDEEVIHEDEGAEEDSDVGNHAIHEDFQESEIERGSFDFISGNDRPLLQSSFDEERNPLPIKKQIKPNHIPEDGYFMAFEDYQNDHSILESNNGNPSKFRNVSIDGGSMRVRGELVEVLDSANLTTPTTTNSFLGNLNQDTGNTTAGSDNDSDLEMTID